MEQKRHTSDATAKHEVHDPLVNDGNSVERVEAVCGMCGQALHPELDDIFVELCRTCEQSALKGRQTRANVPNSHPKRLPKQ